MKRLSHELVDRMMAWLLWGSVVLGIGLRFLWVGKREFWYDEVLSVLFSTGQKAEYKLPKDVTVCPERFFEFVKDSARRWILRCAKKP